jgi:hypothetical protein
MASQETQIVAAGMARVDLSIALSASSNATSSRFCRLLTAKSSESETWMA